MDTRPSFFKVLIFHHFHTHLRLPPHFSQRYGSDLPHKVKLRVCSGRTWGVEVGPLEDGMFGFKSGWKEFAEEVGLKFGEFVVFCFDGKSIFDVAVYGKTACKREIHLHHHTNRDTNSRKRTRGRSPEILIEVPVKRARGTPSKPRIVPPTGAKGGTSKPKRGRGRPPKRKSSNGRGRPPKSSSCINIQGVPNRCSVCEITKTPMWRTGPNGPRTLCNACGLKFRLGRLETSASPVRSEIGKWSYVELEKENEQLLKENKEMASRLKSVEEHWSNQKGDLKARVKALVKDQLQCHYFNGLSQKG